MSKMIAVRLDDRLLARVDRERRKAGLSRARAVHEGLRLWMEQRRLREAIQRDHEGYERHPVREGEFSPVLGAQVWPSK